MKKLIHLASLAATGLILLPACSSSPKSASEKVPSELVSTPADPNLERIVIPGTNDIHGTLAPFATRSREPEGTPSVPYSRGGAAILATHLKILREEYGSQLLHFDAGDHLQGSIESNMAEGAPIVALFNAIGLSAATIGNHEFHFGRGKNDRAASSVVTEATPTPAPGSPAPGSPAPAVAAQPAAAAATPQPSVQVDTIPVLKARISEARYPYVVSNVTYRGARIPKTVPRLLLQAGKTKVGVLGVTTLETPLTSRPELVRSLEFEDMKKATLREARELREDGANVIVLIAHAGIKCDPDRTMAIYHIRRPTDIQGGCSPREELVKLLNDLPRGTVDAVVSGHSHQLVHHWVAGVPVIQGLVRGFYYNMTHLVYDHANRRLVPEMTRIEGPVPVCPQVFRNQGDCNGERAAPSKGRGGLVTPTLYGEKVTADPDVEDLLAPVFEKSEQEKKRVVGTAARRVDHYYGGESPLGNFVADMIREKLKTDVALVNPGAIRASFEEGPITFGDVFRALPFDNSISKLTVTGKELKNILRVAETGARGFFAVSGVRMRILQLSEDAPSNDLNGDGRIEPWEVNRLLEVTLADGRPIEDQNTYTLGTVDFLVTGGDDMGWVMSQVAKKRTELYAGPTLRDTVIEGLERHPNINAPDQPLLDPGKPRLQFVKLPPKKSKTKARPKAKRSRRNSR